MFVELGATALIFAGISYIRNTSEREFKNKFNNIMEGCGLKNKLGYTYEIKEINKTNYGYNISLLIPPGLSAKHLEDKKNILEDNLSGLVEIEKNKFSNLLQIRFIDNDIDKFEFEPVKCKENQLYIGKDFKGKNYFLDLNKDPHILIGGVTGTGKSFLLGSILTNLIYNNSDKIEIYLSQIVKGEIGAFSNCKGVEYTSYDIEEIKLVLEKICKKIDERSEKFTTNGIKNITSWNNHFKKNKMKRVFCVLEELSFFMGNEDVWEYLLKIMKAGRSCGIHCLGLLQRSTATNLNTDVKAQMTRITFRQKSVIDSNNIINCNDAIDLRERECIVDGNSDKRLIKVPFIDEDFKVLQKYVKEIIVPGDKEKTVVYENKITFKEIEPPKEEKIIINVEPKDIKVKPKRKRQGVISMEEYKNVNK